MFGKQLKPIAIATASFAGDVALSLALQEVHSQLQKALITGAKHLGFGRKLNSPLGRIIVEFGPTVLLYAGARWMPLGPLAKHRPAALAACRGAAVAQGSSILGLVLPGVSAKIMATLTAALVSRAALGEAPADSEQERLKAKRSPLPDVDESDLGFRGKPTFYQPSRRVERCSG